MVVNKHCCVDEVTSKPYVSTCPAGLGNRIKCMISTLRRCDESINIGRAANPYVYWPLNKQCGCEFKELFEAITVIKEIRYGELLPIIVDARWDDAYINKSWKLNPDDDIDFKYYKLSKEKIETFLPYFWHIIPKKDIVDAAWAFSNKYADSFSRGEVVGVHIRKGDFKGLYDGRKNISQEQDFMKKIEGMLKENPNYKFLLCTEDEETENKFVEKFGADHIIYFPKKFRERNNTNGVKEAFVDILLLSKCSVIIGTFLSTFTEIAWWIGGCKAKVIIPGTDNKEAVAKVLAKLPQEGEGIHKKIIRKIKLLGERMGLYE